MLGVNEGREKDKEKGKREGRESVGSERRKVGKKGSVGVMKGVRGRGWKGKQKRGEQYEVKR